jgi:uncharacterized SAM-binding protein YcdF (DUF218 family)
MKKSLLFSLLIITITFSSCSLALKRAQTIYSEVSQHQTQYDAIIVPGVPLKNGAWDSTMKARVLWSVYLYKNGLTKNIIYSGSAVYTPYYEAVAMGLYAQKLGVSPEHIFYDTLAKHSTENVYYSYKLAKQLGYKKVALATDPFQSVMLKGFTRKRFQSHIQHIPVIFDLIKPMNNLNPSIDADVAFKPSFKSIVETESLPYRLMGTMGKQIDLGPDKKLGAL